MIPKSLSATALHTAELCMARYKAENIDYARGSSNRAADLGTSLHGALEMYVRACYIEKTHEPSLDMLITLFKMQYISLFGNDLQTIEFMDGVSMCEKWFARTSFENVTVISCEKKDHFDIPTSIGPIPYNYIWDRFDQIGPKTFKVVDYKSWRWQIRPDDLKKKVQARAYALAAAIQLKSQGIEYDKIWVEFDQLRGERVGIVFNWQDNKESWDYFLHKAQEIIDTPDADVKETLNPDCSFCIRKVSCETLQKNVMVGGVFSIPTLEEAVDVRAQLEWQRKAVIATLAELDTRILAEARQLDQNEFESSSNSMKIKVSKTRTVDAERVEKAIGPNLFERYGGKSFNIGTVDKLLKGNELTPEQKADLRSLIYLKTGEPKVAVESKAAIGED